MLMTELVQLAKGQYAAKGLIGDSVFVVLLDQIQKISFTRDLEIFKKWVEIDLGDLEMDGLTLAFPDDLRKIIGITTVTDKQIFNSSKFDSDNFDFGLRINSLDERKMWVPGRIDIFAKTFKFIDEPSTEKTYRWVYYRKPTTIDDIADDTQLLIPEEYHLELIFGALEVYTTKFIYGKDELTAMTGLKSFVEEFWINMGTNVVDMGEDNNLSDGAF